MRAWIAVGVVAALCGCYGATIEQLQSRAAFDLRCPANRVQVVEIDRRTRGVTGCGQQATYVETCLPCHNGYPACNCTWVLNADVSARPQVAAAPAPVIQQTPGQPPVVVNVPVPQR